VDFACRLAERAWRAGHRVYVHAADESAAGTLDTQLWRFRDTAFVPHERLPASPACPVVIGCGEEPPAPHDVLITLGDALPPFYDRFQRVAEILLRDDEARATGRERWKAYRAGGCTLESHEIQNLRGEA
jgi:DNA polymerase-3 subunit chi